MWIWALWGYMMRSARTVGFLTALTIAFGLSFLLMSPMGSAVRIALLIGAAIALASLASAFVALPSEVRRYDAVYSGAMQKLGELGKRRLDGELTPEDVLAGLEIVEAQLSASAPPNDQWRRLHDQTVAHLRSQRNLYQQALTGIPVPDAALEQSRVTGMALVEDHQRLWRASRTFGKAADLFG
ncbi:MAG: hypothetical protein ACRDHD_09865 [Candidatus Limnocylindria bacterium]